MKWILAFLLLFGFATSTVNLRVGRGSQLLRNRFRGSPSRYVRPNERLFDFWDLYVQSNGDEDAFSVSIGFYISLDLTVTTADRLLLGGRTHLIAIPANQNVEATAAGGMVSATWPDSTLLPDYCGWMYLGAIIDESDAVDETNENDNVAAYATYLYCQPDVYANIIRLPGGNTIVPDLWFNITAQIGNGGYGDSGRFNVRFYLQQSHIFNISTARLLTGGDAVVLNLPQDQRRTWTQLVAIDSNTLPSIFPLCSETLNLYVHMFVDALDSVNEDIYENNNYVATRVELDCRPNLQVNDLAIPKTEFLIDEPFGDGFIAQIINRGMTLGGVSLPNPGFRLSWYVSEDETITREDRKVKASANEFTGLLLNNRPFEIPVPPSAKISSVAPNANYTDWCGDVWIGALVDFANNVEELNEEDNFQLGPVQIHVDCGDCEEDSECPQRIAPTCVPANPVTGPTHCGCSEASDCPSLLKDCVLTECVECSKHPHCGHLPDRRYCKDNECVGCISNSHCANDTYCDLGQCVECRRDSHCEGDKRCRPDSNTCVPQCWQNDHCDDGAYCTCDGYCVDCLRDGHCEKKEECVNGACKFSCVTNEECYAFRPGTVCHNTRFECVECYAEDRSICQANPINKRCHVPSNTCVQCKRDEHCSVGEICRDNACVPPV